MMKMLTKRMKTIMTAIMILEMIFVEDGDDVFVDGSEDGDHNFCEEYRC